MALPWASSSSPGCSSPGFQRRLPGPSAFIDQLSKSHQLRSTQIADLQSFVWLGEDLSRGDLLLRIASQAQLYRVENLLADLLQKEDKNSTTLDEIKESQDVHDAKLSSSQKADILSIAMDVLATPTLSSYTTIDKLVMDRLRAKKKAYKVAEFFETADKECSLLAYVRTACRSKRDQLRIIFIAAVNDGTDLSTLSDQVARKYQREGVSDIPPQFSARIALILSFASNEWKNMPDHGSRMTKRRRCGTAENENDNSATNDNGPSKADGFWVCFDAKLKELIKTLGSNLESAAWHSHIKEVIRELNLSNTAAIIDVPTFPAPDISTAARSATATPLGHYPPSNQLPGQEMSALHQSTPSVSNQLPPPQVSIPDREHGAHHNREMSYAPTPQRRYSEDHSRSPAAAFHYAPGTLRHADVPRQRPASYSYREETNQDGVGEMSFAPSFTPTARPSIDLRRPAPSQFTAGFEPAQFRQY